MAASSASVLGRWPSLRTGAVASTSACGPKRAASSASVLGRWPSFCTVDHSIHGCSLDGDAGLIRACDLIYAVTGGPGGNTPELGGCPSRLPAFLACCGFRGPDDFTEE